MYFIVLQIPLIYNLIVWVCSILKSNTANPARGFFSCFLAPNKGEFKISKKYPKKQNQTTQL